MPSRAALRAAGLLWLAAGLPSPLPAQAPDTSMVLRAVQVQRGDIFEPAEAERSWLARIANAIHGTTVHRVIHREVLLEAGQPWDSALAAETERNLRALRIFRSVHVDTARTDSGLVATVATRDGWSTGFSASYRSTGGDIAWGVSATERNLFGTATNVSVRYRDTPDRTSTVLDFSQPRLINGRVGLGFSWHNRSDGVLLALSTGEPYFTLASPSAWNLFADHRDETVYRYADGITTPRDTFAHREARARVTVGRALRADSRGYLRASLAVEARRDDYAMDPESPGRSLFGTLSGSLAWSRAQFVVVRGYEGVDQQEDVELSRQVQLGLAVTPAALGYDDFGLVPSLGAKVGVAALRGFVLAELGMHGRFTGAGLDSGRVLGAVTGFTPTGRNQSVVLHASAGAMKNPAPGTEFDLGFDVGPRSFGVHAFAGDRAVFAMAEYRWYPIHNLFGLVSVGMAGFADWGGAWYDGSPRRTGWDAGIGLRLDSSRSPDPDAIRFDLGWRSETDVEAGGWVLSIGSGLPFEGLRL